MARGSVVVTHSAQWLRTVSAAIALVAALSAASTVHAQVDNAAQGQFHFGRGRDAFVRREFQQALEEFRQAVALVGSPNTRLYIARCLHELGRNAEAYFEYQRAAAEAADRAATEPRYAVTRDTARTEGAALQALFGTLVVRVPDAPPGVAVIVGDNPLLPANYGVATPFDARDVVVRATAPGRLEFRTTVHVEAQRDNEVVVRLLVDPLAQATASARPASVVRPVPPATRRERVGGGMRYVGIATLGVGVVAGASSAILYGLAVSRFNELRAINGLNPNDPRINEGASWEFASNVLGIAGGVLIVAGAVMTIVGGPQEVVRPATPAGSARLGGPVRVTWSPWCTSLPQGSGGLIGLAGTM